MAAFAQACPTMQLKSNRSIFTCVDFFGVLRFIRKATSQDGKNEHFWNVLFLVVSFYAVVVVVVVVVVLFCLFVCLFAFCFCFVFAYIWVN